MGVARPELGPLALRVTHAKHGTRSKNSSPRYSIQCGCCDEKIDIFYSEDEMFDLEINGVDGSIENWREILLPLLGIEHKDGEFIDASPRAKEARKTLEKLREKYPQ